MKIIILQPALPKYRLDFFERINKCFDGEFRLYFSSANLGSVQASKAPVWATELGRQKQFVGGILWQPGAISISLKDVDALVVCGEPRVLSTLLLIAKARCLRVPVYWWGHLWSATSTSFRFRIRRFLMQLAHGFVFYTENEAKFFRSRFSDRKPVIGLNNGLQIEGELDEVLEVIDSRVRGILFIGRLTEKSGFNLFLECIDFLRRNNLKVHVISERSGEYYKEIVRKINILAAVDVFVFHGEVFDFSEILEISKGTSIFAYPGAVGLSLIHAMSLGLPCVIHSNRSRQMPEADAFVENKSGFYFDENDAVSFKNAIAAVLSSGSRSNEMGTFNVGRFREEFNTKKMAEKFVFFLRQHGLSREK